MAAYYTFLAPLNEPCQVRWSYYNDSFSGEPLIAACLPAFKKQAITDPTTCAGGVAGCVNELLGVVCMDVSLIVSRATLEARSDAAAFFDLIEQDRTTCATKNVSASQLQYLRSLIPSQFGDAQCPSLQPAACTSSSSTRAVRDTWLP